MASVAPTNASARSIGAKLDASNAPTEQGNEIVLRHGTDMGRGENEHETLDLTIEGEEYPNLAELVRHVRGTLAVSARSWEPANARHISRGLEANQGLKGLALDLQGCRHSDDDLRCLVDAVRQHHHIESFELCLYQEERENDIVLEECVGRAVGSLLANGTLKHLRFVNWFGYAMTVGFVREMCRGLACASSLVSFELPNCVLPRASYGFLSSALRSIAATATIATLSSLTVGIDSATLVEINELFEALKDLKNVRSIRIAPCHLSNDGIAALERAIEQNASIHFVSGFLAAGSKAQRRRRRRRLNPLLEVNRHVSAYRTLLTTPGIVAPPAWPIVLARLGEGRGNRSDDDDDSDDDGAVVVRRHHANHVSKALRRLLPWLVAQPQHGEVAVGA